MMNLTDKTNAANYEESYRCAGNHQYPNENIVRLTKWFFGRDESASKSSILDYGYGAGENLIHLLKSGFNVTGVEISKNAKKLVDQKLEKMPHLKSNVSLVHLSEKDDKLPFEDGSFDFILSNQVIYFLADEAKIRHLLQEFKRVLKLSGKCIITMASAMNRFKLEGQEIHANVYKHLRGNQEYLSRLVYIVKDEVHARNLFSDFTVNEVGWFDNHYCGDAGHHFVVLATK